MMSQGKLVATHGAKAGDYVVGRADAGWDRAVGRVITTYGGYCLVELLIKPTGLMRELVIHNRKVVIHNSSLVLITEEEANNRILEHELLR